MGPEVERIEGESVDRSGIARMGMNLFLVSLAMLFAASLVGYLVIRLTSPVAAGADPIELPLSLWLSSLVLLVSGRAVHSAWTHARHMRLNSLRRALVWTLLSGLAFIGVQAPSMLVLLERHRAFIDHTHFGIYGLTLALILVHAFHVLGGMLPLGWLTYKGIRYRLGQRDQAAVRACAVYWHFLEVVWFVLFATFLLTN